jgi:diguanylate cyclase
MDMLRVSAPARAALRLDVSRTAKLRVYLLTAMGTAACVALALLIDSYSFVTGEWDLADRWTNNILIPIVVAPPFFYMLLSKVRELALAQGELLALASTDRLTNCLNRGAFSALVDAYLERMDGLASRDSALLLLDVDHFKLVNDRFGHLAGDEALRLIAASLKQNTRELDLVARLGGEEFGVFLPGLDAGSCRAVAERLRSAVAAIPFSPHGESHRLTASIGGAAPFPSARFEDLYRESDQRLYEAKHAGRNAVVFATH